MVSWTLHMAFKLHFLVRHQTTLTQITSHTMFLMFFLTLPTMCTKHAACQSPFCVRMCEATGCLMNIPPACSVSKSGLQMNAFQNFSQIQPCFSPYMQTLQIWKCHLGATVPMSLWFGTYLFWRVSVCQSSFITG